MRFFGALAILLGVTTASYAWNLGHEFQYDDLAKIVERDLFRDPGSFWRAFGSGIHAEAAARFLPNLTLSLNRALGGVDPFGYHLTNLLFHLVNVVLVASFGRALLRRAGAASDGAALLGAALFALHPLNTEAVNYCNARPNVMVTTFYLAALIAALRATAPGRVGRRTGAWIVFGIAVLCALLSKELAVTLVVVAPLTLLWFADDAAQAPDARRRVLAIGGVLALFGVAVGVATGAWRGAWDQVVSTGTAVTGHWLSYVAVTVAGQSEIFLRYLALAVVPWPGFFNIDHRAVGHLHERLFEQQRVVEGALGIALVPLVSLAVVLVLVRLGFAWRRRAPVAGFFVLWPFLTHAPTSLVPRGEVMVEYRTYLPMVGICLGLAWALARLHGWCATRRPTLASAWIARAAAGVLLAVLVVGTVARNRAWTTREAMWRDSVEKAPGNARAHNGLGIAARERGDLDAALAHFRRAVEADPEYPESRNNLGALLAQRGESQQALPHLLAAIRLDPDQSDAYNNVGNVLTRLGRFDEALDAYRRAIERHGNFPEAELNMGMTLARAGRVDEALEHYQRSARLAPNVAVAHLLVGRALVAKGRVDEALASFERAVALAPGDADAHAELGKALSYRGDYAGAVRALERAVAIDPNHRQARGYLAELRRTGR